MKRRGWIASSALLASVLAVGGGLAAWKYFDLIETDAAMQSAEPAETITVALARETEHRRTSTAIGTVLALRSVTLRNEVAGTVKEVNLVPGQIVEPGTLLVALDVSVEEAELHGYEAQAELAQTLLNRLDELGPTGAASLLERDRARTERDVALAQIERAKAIIDRKTIRAPFRARVGLADVHVGQYLEAGTLLTTLQGVDESVHVDFSVAQWVAAGLREGDVIEVSAVGESAPLPATITAIDARVDPETRNRMVRARIDDVARAPAPGASVRVRVPVGAPSKAVILPVSALRKGPEGDHVFVIAPGADGQPRAQLRQVISGPILGNEILIHSGLMPGEQVAASGSFKLREDVLVAIAGETLGGTAAANHQ